MKKRREALRAVESRRFDVCVIGAGATGAGCALDAQLRGLQTVLVDAADFSSATSSASTKLAHGGVRYLQQAVTDFDLGQLKVVWRALRERRRMIENAPHLVHPLEFVVPCFSTLKAVYYGSGLKLYDLIAGESGLGASRVLSAPNARSLLPLLDGHGLARAVTYLDGQFDDARYSVTLVKTFAEAGGEVANYLRVTGLGKGPDGKLSAAHVEDTLSGAKMRVEARVFVNATGPFSDMVRGLASPGSPSRLVLSKGSHILLPVEGGVNAALLIPETEDGRIIFAIPWLGRLLVGTTDTEARLEEEMIVTREEAEYLLRHLNRYSSRQYKLGEIVSAFAGIRPLVRAAHRTQTKKLIREHEVLADAASGLISILGGKWTTYRAMAEDTIDRVELLLQTKARPCATAHHRLAGAEGYAPQYWQTLSGEHSLSEATARHLAGKYGTQAAAVVEISRENSLWADPIVPGAPQIQAEIIHAVRREMAMTIEDVLARRTGLELFDWRLAIEAAPLVASHLARELAWAEEHKAAALRDYVVRIERRLSALGLASR
jgi:glycerol-3-phosphate dehydrogenase